MGSPQKDEKINREFKSGGILSAKDSHRLQKLIEDGRALGVCKGDPGFAWERAGSLGEFVAKG
jgi:hypothetical protein